MAATPSIKVVKTFMFNQSARNFSNRYHFNGGTPSDATHWHTLMDAVTAAEKLIYSSEVQIVDAIGYAAGSDVPVASKSYSLNGTMTGPSDGKRAPGTMVGLVRYATAARTSKNHPVYLFNYYHGAWADYTSTDEWDVLHPTQAALMATYAGDWMSGFSDGTLTLVRAGPNGATATGAEVEAFLTHRKFPR